jgi:hypothetical protein
VALAAVSLGLLSTVAAATPVCRWVDEAGRTHLTDVVPERYKAWATCTDSNRYELSASQRRAALKRVEEDRAATTRAAATPPLRPASGTERRTASASGSVVKRPAEGVTDATDCATWWHLYDESIACFGPFRTTRGATKVEAFEVCNAIASPEPMCGARSQ